MFYRLTFTAIFLVFLLLGCSSNKGMPVREVAVDETLEGISGVGLESQDIDRMTKEMAEDLMTVNEIRAAFDPPKIIVDSKRLINESSQIINTSLLADRLRINLLRDANGRMLFLSRENFDAVLEESKISDELQILPADYRLTGRITSISGFSQKTGVKSNFVQIAYELLDLKTSVVIWAKLYEVKKVGADDTIYQ